MLDGVTRLVHAVKNDTSWGPGEQRVYVLDAPIRVHGVRLLIHSVGGRQNGRTYVVLSGASLLSRCEDALAWNNSARADQLAQKTHEPLYWRKWIKEIIPWSWRVELLHEVARECLAIAYYVVQGWL